MDPVGDFDILFSYFGIKKKGSVLRERERGGGVWFVLFARERI